MKAPHHAFGRYFLKGGAVLLLLAAGLGALLWAVFNHWDWLVPILGSKRTSRLVNYCVATRLQLPATDTDGDGVPDWYELRSGTDPENPKNHPEIEPATIGHPRIIYTDERTRLQWGIDVYCDDCPTMRLPSGFRVAVVATSGILLAPGSKDPPAKGPLHLTASKDGTIEFDVLISDSARDHRLIFFNSGTQERIGEVGSQGVRLYSVGRRLPAIPAKVEMRQPPDQGSFPVAFPGYDAPRGPQPYVVWDPLPASIPIKDYILEAACADRPNEWVPIRRAEPQRDGGPVSTEYPSIFPGYRGAFKYRIVPTENSSKP